MPAETRTAAFEPGGSALRLLTCRAAERPDHPFLWVQEQGPWTLGGLAAAAAALAGELSAAGVKPSDRVLLRLGNEARFLPALAATWAVGAAAVALHPAAPPTEVDRVVEAFGIVTVIAQGPEPPVSPPAEPPQLVAPDVDAGSDALVLLTSGSTGEPKGVVLSHASVWANIRATVSAFRSDTRPTLIPAGPKPPTLITNPLSHTAGIVRLLFALYVGRSIVLLRKFDARAAHDAVLRHGIDHLTLNPAMLRMLLDALEPSEDLGKVRYVGSGTAPLPAALREEFEDRFGVPVLQAYGQTEAFGGIAVENVRDVLAGNRRPGSVGRPLTGVEVRIRRPDGTDAPAGAEGEIVVRTPSVTTGYLGAADAASPVGDDGWLHTGDLGHRDADGYLFVTGRLKNIIICGGFNVIPEEVEARLMEDPAVRAAAVVPVADDRLGEIPVALVEADGPAADIEARVSERIATYKRPRHLFTVDVLPRVANGKVDQPAARRLAAELVTAGAPTERRIAAIAFDMGGVLTLSALGGLERLAGELGLAAGSISAYFRGDARMAALEVGEMSAREFFKYVCADLEAEHGQRIDLRRLAAAAEEGQVLNPAMIELVRRLREGFTTALVTNNVAEASWRATFPFDLFDVVVDSSAVGVRKPDPRFYQELLRRLDCPATEVLLVDDFEENLAPAAELGLATLHFTGIDAFRHALAELGIAVPSALPPTADGTEPLPHKEHQRS